MSLGAPQILLIILLVIIREGSISSLMGELARGIKANPVFVKTRRISLMVTDHPIKDALDVNKPKIIQIING